MFSLLYFFFTLPGMWLEYAYNKHKLFKGKTECKAVSLALAVNQWGAINVILVAPYLIFCSRLDFVVPTQNPPESEQVTNIIR